MTRRALAVGLVAVVSLTMGFVAGRWSAPTCSDARDEHAAVARQIRAQAQVDLDDVDTELVGAAVGIVDRRPDCFSTAEQEELRLIEARLGSGS